jgi:hypothetical protein
MLGPVTVGGAGPPYTYLGMARHFALGLAPLTVAQPPAAIAATFLCAQLIECALKASLSRDGTDARLKVNPIRHDLARLWALAAAEGLAIDAVAPDWLTRLSALHGAPYYLRYSTGVNAMVSPNLQLMCDGAQQLLAAVERQVAGA